MNKAKVKYMTSLASSCLEKSLQQLIAQNKRDKYYDIDGDVGNI